MTAKLIQTAKTFRKEASAPQGDGTAPQRGYACRKSARMKRHRNETDKERTKNGKQHFYIIRRLTDREITVVGNPRVYKALRDQMKLIYQELQRLAVDEEVPPDLLETLEMVALTLNGLKEECE